MKKKIVLPYDEAKAFMNTLGLSTQIQHNKWFKGNKPEKLPSNPSVTYRSVGWVSWSDYLGSNNISFNNRVYLDYFEAVQVVKTWGVKSKDAWYKHVATEVIPDNIPKRPDHVYKDKGWVSWSHYVSNNRFTRHDMKGFQEATVITKSMGFENMFEYLSWIDSESIDYLPKRPDFVYGSEWTGWLDYLGYERKQSTGENIIKRYLDKNQIVYNREVMIPEIKARFDFYLPNYNIYIEYDGIHHYESVRYFGGDTYFEKTKIQDAIKTKWCEANNHQLLRICYRDIRSIQQIIEGVIS